MKALVNPDLYRPIVRIIDDEETVRNSEAFTLRVVGLETACYATAEEFLEKDDLRYPGCTGLSGKRAVRVAVTASARHISDA